MSAEIVRLFGGKEDGYEYAPVTFYTFKCDCCGGPLTWADPDGPEYIRVFRSLDEAKYEAALHKYGGVGEVAMVEKK